MFNQNAKRKQTDVLVPSEENGTRITSLSVREGLNEIIVTNENFISQFSVGVLGVVATDGKRWLPVEVRPDSTSELLTLYIDAPRGCTSITLYEFPEAAIEATQSLTPVTFSYQNTALALSASHSLAAANNPILSYVHPSIVYFPDGWNGKKYWMTATPWSAAGTWPSEDVYEDAILFNTDDRTGAWTPVNINASGFNNLTAANSVAGRVSTDTRLCYDEQVNILYAYFRVTTSGVETIHRIQTSNGGTWTNAAGTQGAWDNVTLNGNLDWTAGTELAIGTGCLSPSIVKTGEQWDIWATAYEIDGYNDIVLRHATSLDGLAFFGGKWTKPFPKNFQGVWHQDAQYDPEKNQWLMLGQLQGSSNIGASGSTNSNIQMLFTSEDKESWKMWDVPAAISGVDPDTNRSCNCYKGALLYEGDGKWVIATSYRLKSSNQYRVAFSPAVVLNTKQPRASRPVVGVFHESQGRWYRDVSVSGLGIIQREPAWYNLGVNSVASVSNKILSLRRGSGACAAACGTRWKRAFKLKSRLKLATLTSTLRYSHEITPNLGFWFDAPNSRVRLSGDDTATGNWTPTTAWMDVDMVCDRSTFDSGDSLTTTGTTNGTVNVTVGSSTAFYKGEKMLIAGAGVGGSDFIANIVKVVSSTIVTLDAIPPTNVTGAVVKVTRYVLWLYINNVQAHKLLLNIIPTFSAHMGFLASGSVANTDGADILYCYQLPLDTNQVSL